MKSSDDLKSEEVVDTNAQLVKAGPSRGRGTRVPRSQHLRMNDVVNSSCCRSLTDAR